MKLFFPFLFFVLLFNYFAFSESDVGVGYKFMVVVPMKYDVGFIGSGFFMETNETEPNFRVALSIEGVNGKYSCSLRVFVGDVKVWDSGHYSKFYVTEKCLVEFTMDGDLRLKGPNEKVGWKTGTSEQGVKRLQILKTGNLVLLDELNNIKWQSFNFPTDVMLRSQQLDIATRLTSSRTNSSLFYSFEIENNKVALYVNSGNFGLYYYSSEKSKFEASFQALNRTCDLPISCKPYGICTFSNTCSCIQLFTNDDRKGSSSDCNEGFSGGFCGGIEAEMLEIDNVNSVLKGVTEIINVSRGTCSDLCLQDCKCAAALYIRNASAAAAECYLYRLVLGLKQVDEGTGFSYMVKVPKGSGRYDEKHNVKRWIFVVVGVFDGFIILILVGGFGYWLIKRRSHSLNS
uniref:Receptor protein kinase ZmPK1 isoform X2 n=1 Tax=Cicer arietinum TaxID=3827 RepID=A0A1S3E0T7_CICAR|nr:putative receptor protein kinase ZmPK1 isoform X2 [Cicer arietinum]